MSRTTFKQRGFARLTSLLFAILAVLCAAGNVPASAVAPWCPDTQVTATGATSTQAPLFLSGTTGSITAITVETVSSVYSVVARTSNDGGVTWGSPFLLSASGVASSDAAVVKLNNGVFAVAWAEASGASGVNQIRLRSSDDNGSTWTPAQTISTAGNSAQAANNPHLAALGPADLVVGFQQNDGSNDRALVRSSQSQLQSWTQDQTLSAGGSNAKFVVPVTNSNGDILVSWVLVASDSTKQAQVAGSASWNTVTTLSSYAFGGNAKVPTVVALPTGSFVALWPDPDAPSNPNFAITSRSSSDAGLTWDVPVALSSAAFATSVTAVVTIDGGITAAWNMGTGGYTYIESSYSSPTSSPSPSPSSSSSSSPSPTSTGAGSAWSTPVSVSASVTGQYYSRPQLAVSADGTVAMALIEQVNSSYAAGSVLSFDNGHTWPDGIGSVSSWYSAPYSVSDVSLQALTGQGFAFGWLTLNNNNPDAGFARSYGWTATPTPTSTSAPSLPATGISLWVPGMLTLVFFGSGFVFWAITARSRSRR